MDVSLAVFGAQSKSPSPAYLDSVRSFILGHNVLGCVAEQIDTFEETRQFLAAADPKIAALTQSSRYTAFLSEWIANGNSEGAAATLSGIISLPRLCLVQLAQYFHFLDSTGLSHGEFVINIKNLGGLQGFCGGLPAAIALASALTEEQLREKICVALRLAYAVGLYAELGDDSRTPGTTTLVVRLKFEGQATQLIADLSGVYISAYTDPRSVSIVGPAEQLLRLQDICHAQGLQTSPMDIRGKTHNPENAKLADELVHLCKQSPLLDIGSADQLQTLLRSNKSGVQPLQGSLTEVIVRTILAESCAWFDLLSASAADIKRANVTTTTIACFGIGDCTPLLPFHKLGIRATKIQHTSVGEHHRLPAAELKRSAISSYQPVDDAIAIVGAACRFPGANNLEELWDVISNGQDMSQEIDGKRFKFHGSYRGTQSGDFLQKRKFYGNFIKDIDKFDHAFFGINPREAVNMDPQQRLLLQMAHEAMESSGYVRERSEGDDVGCFIGASFVEYLDNTNAHPPTAYTSTGTIRAFLCGRIAYHFGWTGPAEVLDTACSSSLVAINRAVKAIRTGECSMALTGGINAITGVNNFMDLAKAGFLSPTGQCKPFDIKADGYCRSEGGGLVVLKPLKRAQLDGDNIMAVIPGAATNQGGLSCALTIPDSNALGTLYRSALAQAQMKPEMISYVEAHGTGTQAGDPVEIASIRDVFGHSSRPELSVGSIKGNIGHCETAAGVAGLLKVICMLNKRSIPPQASHTSWNTKIPPLSPDNMAISTNLIKWDTSFRAALVNSYGAAGSNAALICTEAPAVEFPPIKKARKHPVSYPLRISAKSESSVRAYQRTLARYLKSLESSPDISRVAYVLGHQRRRYKHSLVLDAASTADLCNKLADAGAALCSQSASGTAKVVLLFAGQSRRNIGLAMQMYDQYPAFRSKLDACDSILQENGYSSILPAVFSEKSIHDIIVLQTGLVAIEYAMAMCWIEAGLQVDAIVGHSLGELAALSVSGMLSIRDCLKLVAARASLMKSRWGPETGSMLAVSTTKDSIEAIIAALDLPIDIACYNGTESQVVAGDRDSVSKLEAHLISLPTPIKSTAVDTSHAFHSRLVSRSILDELDQIAGSLQWQKPKLPIVFCSGKAPSPSSWIEYSPSNHARNPVHFADAVSRVEQDVGKAIWLEIGVNSPIVPMARRVGTQNIGHSFYAMNTPTKASSGEPSADPVVRVVCDLWREGLSVRHWAFLQTSSAQQSIWLPPYEFDKVPVWLDNLDHAADLKGKLEAAAANPAISSSTDSKTENLVALHPSVDLKSSKKRFEVNSHGKRFGTIVSGHAVRNRPLCPASVYLECVANAVQLLGIKPNLRLAFENIDLQAPLGVSSEGVEVELDDISDGTWKFSVTSLAKASPKRQTHGQGIVRLCQHSQATETVAVRLVGKRMQELVLSGTSEKLHTKRAYDMFSRVVRYEPFLRGIDTITMDETEAVATICMRSQQPGQDESAPTVIAQCEAVAMDNFIQIVGLLMNTSDLVGASEVMVCTGIDSCMTTAACDMSTQKTWTVYASFSSAGSAQATGDVFVFAEGSLIVTLTGCRFTKLDMARLEKALDSVNPTSRPPQQDKSSSQVPLLDSASTSSAESISSPGTPVASGHNVLLEVLHRYTGAPTSGMLDDVSLADIGVDSLAAIELAGELSSSCHIIIEGEDLVGMQIGELRKKLPSGALPSSVTATEVELHDSSALGAEPQRSHVGSSEGEVNLMKLLAEITGIATSEIELSNTLEGVGFDSLALVELASGLSTLTASAVEPDSLDLETSVGDLLRLINPGQANASHTPQVAAQSRGQPPIKDAIELHADLGATQTPAYVFDLKAAVQACEESIELAAMTNKFVNYWSKIHPDQDALTLSYIRDGFFQLGINLATIKPGDIVPDIPHQPQHSRLVGRLWDILSEHGVIRYEQGRRIACAHAVPMTVRSSELHKNFVSQHPDYAVEARLMALTGPRLADCLSGQADPIKLLFGTEAAAKLLEEYYGRSPMLSTLTSQLVSFISASLSTILPTTTIKILEVGAGTGGTTAALLERLAGMKVRIQYTFSDISSSMVAKAKRRFAKFDWVSFTRLDLEATLPDSMKNKFDIILGTNCVHATSDRVVTCAKLRQMLSPAGYLVLSEVTRIINWYDLVFGLLPGWWLSDLYPLQSATKWMKVLKDAGFGYSTFTNGISEDLNTQQLLIGGNDDRTAPPAHLGRSMLTPNTPSLRKETVVYKTIEDVHIKADIYLPEDPPSALMPIALLIHGGGHMSLSRRAVRPWQIAHLLSKGILPVSIDYRLAPEINIIDGAMADVRDAVHWCRTSLPSIVAGRSCKLDSKKLVVVGWSSGGHLAMTTAWTVPAVGQDPPTAVLSFYAPTDFLSHDLFPQRPAKFAGKLSEEQLSDVKLLSSPITEYHVQGGEEPDLGWVKKGDSRSELLLSLFRRGSDSRDFGLSLMLNGTSGQQMTVAELLERPPTNDRRIAICPMAQLRDGKYNVPTFIIHGDADDIAPFSSGLTFYEEMKAQGLQSGFVHIPNGKHLHDLRLSTASPQWKSEVGPGYTFLFDKLGI